MNTPKVLGIVLAVHAVPIALIAFLAPGCKSTKTKPAEEEGAVAPALASEAPSGSQSLDSAFNAGLMTHTQRTGPAQGGAASGDRQPPMRPTVDMYAEQPGVAMNTQVLPPPPPSQKLEPQASPAKGAETAGFAYVVQRGDSLWSIARKHQVSLDALLAANNMSKNAVIHPGASIRIPGESPQSAPAAAAAPAAAPMSASLPAEAPAAGGVYTVVPGDSLHVIARKTGVSVQALQSANNMTGTRIYAGQQLRLPSGAQGPAAPVASPAAVRQPAAPAAAGMTHEVKRGETLGAIAKRYGTTAKVLMALNRIDDPRTLRVGQVIVVGAGETAPPPPPAAEPAGEVLQSRAQDSLEPIPYVDEDPLLPLDVPALPVTP